MKHNIKLGLRKILLMAVSGVTILSVGGFSAGCAPLPPEAVPSEASCGSSAYPAVVPCGDSAYQAEVPYGGSAYQTETAQPIVRSDLLLPVGDSVPLESMIDSTKLTGQYTIQNVDRTIILYDDGDEGYGFEISRLIVRPQDSSSMEDLLTFLYLGDRPFIEGRHVKITYFPLRDGAVVTNNDLVAFLMGSYFTVHKYDRIIEGFHGPASIEGIIAPNGVEYLSPVGE